MQLRIRFKGPLASSYPGAVLLVVFALIPYLALTSSITPLEPVLAKSLHMSQQSLELASGMANAGYAVGTVLAVLFASHLPGRRMLFLYATLFVVGSVIAALATTPAMFIAGHVVQGLTTSLMLIAAVPPLVIGWPASKMRWTGMVMNLCVFGAVAAGPLIGGVQAQAHEWRPLFWMVAGTGAAAWLFTVLTFEDQEPMDRTAPWAVGTIVLAGLGCAATFFGSAEMTSHPVLSLVVFLPLIAGLILLVALVAHQYGVGRPLMPVRILATTKPVGAITIALCAGAASVAAIELIEQALAKTVSPGHLGVLFFPQLGGALLAALLFGALFRTRWVVAVPFAGIACLAGGIAVVTGVGTGPHSLVVVGSGLLGIGVGAAVAPALFVAGFSAPSKQLPRVFALVELLRAVAAFSVGPVILHIALTVNGGIKGRGLETAMWICFGIACAGALLATYIFVLGRVTLRAPDLETFLEGEQPAWDSPPLAAGIRGERERVAARGARDAGISLSAPPS